MIMASATSAASFRGQNVQASDQYGIRGLWSPSSVAEIGRCGDRSLEIFLASLDADPDAKGLPAYVQREFYDYLQCGILAHGFLRLGCDTCQKELLLPFSCKRRGFCPSCAGRRMAQTAAHLVECVIPWVPTRQWVVPCLCPYAIGCPHHKH